MAQATGRSTYLPGYHLSNLTHHEWRTAENSAMHLVPTLEAMAGLNPGLTLLDVGAGSGTITASLAKYMPQGHITATDISEEILQRAAEYARKAGASNISFEVANVYKLPFPDSSFDVVHASQVLAHLDAPVQALKEMLRVTKPNGVVASKDGVLHTWSVHPDLPAIAKFQEVLVGTMKAAGGQCNAGAELVSWAMKAGASREQITATMSTWCYSTPEERQIWGGAMGERIKSGAMRKKASELGLATEAELDEMGKAWDEWVATEDACFGLMNGEILVKK
ncbi:hypothetical protein LTR36_007834 [Oleoguttula mirabilis]|uniref:Methyltransferase domain-containing protein n=1 Tax=Oleoguttula mirabilis TaxID=1507867 RepID=A0AAV9J8W0_9PEZI|nr:hypothetical protein LTR36_007834 [Oleoguttula mirabilis]